MPENMIKKMLKTPGKYALEVDKHLKVQVFDLNRTYSFMVDNNSNTKDVYDNGVKMKKTPVPNKHEPQKPEDMPGLPPELGVGCVGLGMLVYDQTTKTDQCQFKWGHWF
jgi:hypothetical protein